MATIVFAIIMMAIVIGDLRTITVPGHKRYHYTLNIKRSTFWWTIVSFVIFWKIGDLLSDWLYEEYVRAWLGFD